MTEYETTHARTAGLHYDGKDRNGKRIIIDAAELSPDRFEVIAMRADGLELACRAASSADESRRIYGEFLRRFVTGENAPADAPVVAPLTGKYARLRDDLKAALAAGLKAESENPEDGGACNFDAASLYLPRWNESLVERAAREAGCSCSPWRLYGQKRFVFNPNTRAQGNARSRNAEAMTAALKCAGYDAIDYCQMD